MSLDVYQGEVATEFVDLSHSPQALESVTRAEIDVQIATAKRFPRSMERFLRDARGMVACDPDLAAQCTYALPARKGGDSKGPISGPSVRLAEMVVLCWGNVRVVGRITQDDGRLITAQGVAIDLEKNVGYSLEVRRGVTTRDGRRFGDDMIKTTCNAAIAIVTRNVTFKVVPRAFVNLIWDEARRVAAGDVKSLPERTGKALDYFRTQGVKEADVFRTLGLTGRADVTLDHLMVLQGFKTSLQSQEATVAEIFHPEPTFLVAPELEARGPGETKTDALSRKLGAKPKAEGREPGQDG